ncbi:HD-GYP domain-containing protein [Sulfurospirillum sp.]|uniref:HD-GYP domain-containing protein n=1 Tax=Sulfurospirillum sp. TaxID=2053622 RepID=UPI002FDE3D9C
MGKVIKIFLNQGFTPIDNSLFMRGTFLDFDCYIQRFNGFAILLESGTLIDDEIYKKLIKRDLQIYVENKNYNIYKHYREESLSKTYSLSDGDDFISFEAAVKNCIDIYQIVSRTKVINEKLKAIYTNAKYLFDAWIRHKEDKYIPIEAIDIVVEELVSVMNQERVTLSKFNDFLDEHDSLAAHFVKVAFFASVIGSQIGIDMSDQKKLVLSAILHDVGKCELDESLLKKPDFLNEDEVQKVQTHSEASVNLVKRSGIKDRIILNAIKEHHERLDGSGYPHGMNGSRISPFAKIIAICDMFDALITIKPYRGAYSTYNALSLIRDESKNRLDADYVKLLIKHLR